MSFRNVIILSVFVLYIIFSVLLFMGFNDFYFKNTKERFKNENIYSGEVVKNLLHEEKETLLKSARVMASDTFAFLAFDKNVTLTSQNMQVDETKVTFDAFPVNRLKFITIANNIKGIVYGRERGSEEKAVQLFNKNFESVGYSAGAQKEALDTGQENYVQSILANANTGGVEVTLINEKENKFYVRALAPIGRSSAVWKSDNPPGIVQVIGNIDGIFLDKLKKITNKEIILVKDNKIATSTVFVDAKRIEEMNLPGKAQIKVPKNGKPAYLEMKLEKDKEMGYHFVPLIGYDQNVIGYIGVGFYMSGVYALYAESIKTFLNYQIVFSILLFVIMYFVLKGLFKPFANILDGINKVSDGKLTHRFNNKRKDELGVLMNGIDKMTDHMDTIVKRMDEVMQNISSSTAEILSVSESNEKSMYGVVDSSEKIRDESLKEINSVKLGVSSIAEINEGIFEIARSSEEAQSISEELYEYTSQGKKAVYDTITSMGNIKSSVVGTSQLVEELEMKMKAIDKVINIITDIADQTNLLSINAAIEATKAGEYGRGFIVVANEVKKLSLQSIIQTEEIRKIIIDIQKETENVTESMKKGLTEVENGVEINKKAGKSLEEINGAVLKTKSVISKIKEYTNEQTRSSKNAVEIIQTIEEYAEKTNELSEGMSNEIKNRLKGIEDILNGINGLLKESSSLQVMIDYFELTKDSAKGVKLRKK